MVAKYSVNFLWIIKVVVYSFKIMGLAPLSVECFENSTCTGVLHSSNFGLAYNILLSLLLLILTVVSFWNSVSMNYTNKSSLTTISDAVLGIMSFCTAWIIIVSWAFKQSKAANIVNKIFELDLRMTMPAERSTGRAFIMIFVYVTINACLWISELILEALLATYPIIVIIYFAVPYLIISSFIAEYCMVVRLIIKELERVNEILSNCNDFRSNFYPRIPFVSCNDSEILPNNSQLAVLQSVHNIRTTLFEISCDISDFFSFPILLSIGTCFSSILTNVYYVITPLVAPKSVFSPGAFTSTVLLIIIIAFPIVILVYNIDQATYEAKLTARVVHKLLPTMMKPEIKSELEQFSLHLLHEEFYFTAYGFFKLDFALLHAMLATMGTYLVIFIQFQ